MALRTKYKLLLSLQKIEDYILSMRWLYAFRTVILKWTYDALMTTLGIISEKVNFYLKQGLNFVVYFLS